MEKMLEKRQTKNTELTKNKRHDESSRLKLTPSVTTPTRKLDATNQSIDIFSGHKHKEMFFTNWLNHSKNQLNGDYIESTLFSTREKMKELMKDLCIIPKVLKSVKQAVGDVKNKIQLCAKYENEVDCVYSAMSRFGNNKRKHIDDMKRKMHNIALKKVSSNRQAVQKFCKVNMEIDFVLNKRDETLLRIANAKKAADDMTLTLTKLQESCKRFKNQIQNIGIDYANDSVIFKMKCCEEQRQNEKAEILLQLKDKKRCIEGEQEKLTAALAENNKSLAAELEDTKTKKMELEKRIACVRESRTENKRRIKKRRQLLKESQFIDITGKQSELDKRQQQYDQLNRLKKQILEKCVERKENETKLSRIKLEVSRNQIDISHVEQQLKNMVACSDKEAKFALHLAKRARMTIPSSSSSDDSPQFEISSIDLQLPLSYE